MGTVRWQMCQTVSFPLSFTPTYFRYVIRTRETSFLSELRVCSFSQLRADEDWMGGNDLQLLMCLAAFIPIATAYIYGTYVSYITTISFYFFFILVLEGNKKNAIQ
jgi:hypothetical protein